MNVGSRQDGVANIQAFILFLISDLHMSTSYLPSVPPAVIAFRKSEVQKEGLDLDSLDSQGFRGPTARAPSQSLRLKKYY